MLFIPYIYVKNINFHSLVIPTTLKMLYLGENQFTDAGLRVFFQAIKVFTH